MPTYEITRRFRRDFERLTPAQQASLREAVTRFVSDIKQGHFQRGLRVKAVRGTAGIYEMIWAPDGRATFEYGRGPSPGDVHVVWRRCGTHAIFDAP